jgi:hypothetical protein
VNSDAAGERGARFCDKVPKRHRHRCFTGVGSVMASIEQTEGRLRTALRGLCGRNERACLEGAGLVAAQS